MSAPGGVVQRLGGSASVRFEVRAWVGVGWPVSLLPRKRSLIHLCHTGPRRALTMFCSSTKYTTRDLRQYKMGCHRNYEPRSADSDSQLAWTSPSNYVPLYMNDLRAFGSLKYRAEDRCLVSQPLPVLLLPSVLL